MSEENTQEVAVNGEGQQGQGEDLAAQLEQLKTQNSRLLQESKKYKVRHDEIEELRSLVNNYKAKEEKQLAESGNYAEMYERQIEKYNALKNDFDGLKKKTLKANVFNAINNVAKDAHDVNDLLNQPEFASMIEVDEGSLEPTSESIHTFVNTLKEKKGYLFNGKRIAPMGDANPTPNRVIEKPLKKLNKKEAAEEMRKSIGQLLG